MSAPGTAERPLCVAVIGAGPSGFYAVEALLKAPGLNVRVDLFDRLPTPYGLARGGVAPDHQKIKSVTAVYDRAACDPRVRFFGNVKLGKDVTVDELRARYDQIVYAVGCESDRKMGIPGEDLKGSYSATDFVGWYNGHPDYRDIPFDLNCEAAAVVGIGNVAIDVIRILAQDPDVLAKTDIAEHAVSVLRQSQVKRVYLLGRRGPVQAAFSPKEIEEVGEIKRADLVVKEEELKLDEVSKAGLCDAAAKKNYDCLLEAAHKGAGRKDRKIFARFCVSPVELIGKDGKVCAIKLERNNLEPDGKGSVKARGLGRFETIEGVGLVFRSVGYRGIPVPGVPFDEKAGRVANADGRVVAAVGGPVVLSEYVVGWAKRGPSGLIGTNRACSVATVGLMLEDLRAGKLAERGVDVSMEAAPRLLASKAVKVVSFAQWKEIDKLEIANGKKSGKIREKFTRVAEMLSAMGPSA
ncbi:MAG TPA: NADP oxidoreductase [Elusimicrobia bacterium]|nr:MAG: NADP oxidoreductase [Elusimicrobia bacterium GWA2_66_18]HAZ08474.1 NADP oxidoreductase [Elusimicrobiota bacterium]